MKKIVPFKKNISFKTNLAEIVSISLEHSLKKVDDNLISGNFVISGTYKMTEGSLNVDEFSYNLPFDINMSEKYIIDNVNIEIDDFFYEIINDDILSVNIDVLVDNIEEQAEELPFEVNKTSFLDILEETRKEEDIDEDVIDEEEERECYEEEEEPPKIENNNIEMKSLFESMDDSTETYSTYKIYIVREGDTIETIIQKYQVQRDVLELYNDINELKIGDKVIIPVLRDEKV